MYAIVGVLYIYFVDLVKGDKLTIPRYRNDRCYDDNDDDDDDYDDDDYWSCWFYYYYFSRSGVLCTSNIATWEVGKW